MWWLAELAVVKRSTLYLIIIEAGFGVCFCLMAKSEALGLNKDGVFLGRWFHVKTLPYCIRIIVGELDEEHHP